MLVTTYAQGSNTLYFEHLSVEDGLPHTAVHSILQDPLGFMWFATDEGLAKYDGYKFHVYNHKPTNPNSLSESNILSLYQDSHANLWVTTLNHGINKFNPKTEIFVHYRHDESNPHRVSSSRNMICNIYEDQRGHLWFGTADGGLNRFDPDTEQFTAYQHDKNDPNTLSHNHISYIYPDPYGQWLWIGTQYGLNQFEPKTGQTIRYIDDNDFSNNIIHAIYISPDQKWMWVGTEHGLNRVNRHDGTIKRYIHHKDKPESLSHNFVSVIYPANNGQLWIGTSGGGLNLFNPNTDNFVRYQSDINSSFTLSDDTINSIFKDKTGTLWIGTILGGLNKLDPQRKKFHLYQHNPNNLNSLTISDLFGMHIDRQGIVWIGTTGGGLNKFDPMTEQFTRYQHDKNQPQSLSHNFVHPILEDSQGFIWVGTWGGGLNKFDPQTETFTHYQQNPDDPHSLSGNRVRAIVEDDLGNLWIGTHFNGVNKFDGQYFTHYRHQPGDHASLIDDNIWNIFKDSRGNLWISTGHGFEWFNPKTEQFVHYQHDDNNLNSLSNNAVQNVYEDKQGILWLTTQQGINKFDPKTKQFTHYFKTDGLPHNRIQSILGDNQGYLWITTIKGMARFNPQTETFKTYDINDGLQGDFFRAWAYAKHPNGELYFGGSNGLNRFNPTEITDNHHQPPVVLTDFLLFNEPVPIGDGSVLNTHISELDSITLTHDLSAFSFEFAGLNYTSSIKNQYVYKMEGFDKDWTKTDAQRRFATYTNLDAGTYTFRVKASNNDGVWNEQEKSIKVIILPPWWETLWFRGIVFMLVISIIFGGFWWRVNLIKRQKRQLEIQVDERTRELRESQKAAEAANQAKSTFLANMSHELRSPLNAILGFAQIMTRSQRLDKENQENVGIISRSGEHLLNLINQVLDLSKIEAGRTTINENHFDCYRLLDDLEDMFHLKADDKHLQLLFERELSVPQYLYTDELKLRQVLINLLNNALKFTIEGGITVRINSKTIETELKQQRAIIEFAVEDTGPGIAPDELDELFTAFVQTSTGKQSQEGTGLGLPISRKFVQLMGGDMIVTSEVGRGSTFQFQIQCQLSESTQIKQSAHEKRIIALAPNQPRYRILIVDDKWTNRQLLIKLLNPLGFELKEAENGQQAIAVWEEWEPHLIWMDMRMPVMDGYTATQQIKAHIKGQATAIVALTASVLEEERAVVLSAGCDDFLRKPFKEHDIFDIMHKQIGVEYIYDEPTQTSAIKSQKNELTPDNLATLPAELLARFEEATELSEPDLIESIINEIRVQSPNLANGLAELAEMFDYDAILDLIQQAQGLQS